ncbi:hypothetical protein JCM11251_003425 [Rhodosporidiobolus azoricus]
MGSSIDVNPSTANIALASSGSGFLWAWFSLFAASALVLLFVAHQRPVGHRAFHYIGTAVLIITALSYFFMASNLSWTPIEYVRSGSRGANQIANGAPNPPTRSISYGRYIQFFLTWPLLLLMLHLATGFALSRVFFDLFVCECAVVCFLTGALIRTRYKWGPYTNGGPSSTPAVSPPFVLATLLAELTSAPLSSLFWFGLFTANIITVTSEAIAYGILDLLTTIFFTFFFLYNCEGLDYDRFEFASGKYPDTALHPGAQPPTAQNNASGPGLRHGLRGTHDTTSSPTDAGPQSMTAPGVTPTTTATATGGTGGGVGAIPGGNGVEGEVRTGPEA